MVFSSCFLRLPSVFFFCLSFEWNEFMKIIFCLLRKVVDSAWKPRTRNDRRWNRETSSLDCDSWAKRLSGLTYLMCRQEHWVYEWWDVIMYMYMVIGDSSSMQLRNVHETKSHGNTNTIQFATEIKVVSYFSPYLRVSFDDYETGRICFWIALCCKFILS